MPVLTQKQGKRSLKKKSPSSTGRFKKKSRITSARGIKVTVPRAKRAARGKTIAEFMTRVKVGDIFPEKNKRAVETLRRTA